MSRSPSDSTSHELVDTWRELAALAGLLGFPATYAVPREPIDEAFGGATGADATPARLAPDYRRAIVLGSGGVRLWTLFEAARGARMLPAEDPLDAFCERQVGRFLSAVRAHDPHAQSAFPFRHERQIVPFSALLAGMDMLRPGPFGLAVDPVYGPWLAWRGVVFTALELPVMPPLPQPCERCSAPCVAACPAEAVHTGGFDWNACGTFRLTQTTCQETCHARLACPVGTAHRYSHEQMRYHYVAGLRELEQSRR